MRNKLTLFLKTTITNLYSLDLPLFITNTRDSKFGDYTVNILFTLEKQAADFDRENFLEKLVADKPSFIEKIEFTKNGFINFYLDNDEFLSNSLGIVSSGDFGKTNLGKGKRVLLEFVSANPTGPLHIGHGRGAVIGDVLGNVLAANGYDVEREYYINDAGRQMDILAMSVWVRYLQLFDSKQEFPAGAYQGEYIVDIAKGLELEHRDIFQGALTMPSFEDTDQNLDNLILQAKEILGEKYKIIHAFTLEKMLIIIKEDLKALNVKFDTWFSEKSLYTSGKVQEFVANIIKKDLAYDKDGAVWFKSSSLGDEKDRVMQRTNGEYTYFASDIAYHVDKYERGFDLMINIWGADHHGYIKRVKNALSALKFDPEKLKIKLLQFVSLVEEGEKIAMSTRKANFIDVRELVAKVGLDSTRYFYVMKDSDQSMEFDLAIAVAQNNDNPVWYIQYALARINAIIRKKEDEAGKYIEIKSDFNDMDKELVLKLLSYEDIVAKAGSQLQAHLIANYLLDVARGFHHYYSSTRVFSEDSLDKKYLDIYLATKSVIEKGLYLLGVKPIDEKDKM